MTGIFINARVGSTRLKNKHFIEVQGKPFIEWLLLNIHNEFTNEISQDKVKVFITSGQEIENQVFENFCLNYPIKVFYGDSRNIPYRHLTCALANQIENIISVDGDDILCSTNAMRLVFERLNSGKTIVQTQGLPLGMNVMGYKTEYLNTILNNENHKILETGWGRIFDRSKIENIIITTTPNNSHIRLTLDYEVDAHLFIKILEYFRNEILYISDEELIRHIKMNNWHLINQKVNDEYWTNFNNQKKAEG